MTVTMGTSMSIYSLILFPEAEMKVGILNVTDVRIQVWQSK